MEEVTDEPLYRDRVCGTGIGKTEMHATIRVPSDTNPERRMSETRAFATTRRGVLALADWLRSWQVPAAVMEATSTYGMGPFFRLEAEGLECVLADAKQVKNLPGRPKRDPSASSTGPAAGSRLPGQPSDGPAHGDHSPSLERAAPERLVPREPLRRGYRHLTAVTYARHGPCVLHDPSRRRPIRLPGMRTGVIGVKMILSAADGVPWNARPEVGVPPDARDRRGRGDGEPASATAPGPACSSPDDAEPLLRIQEERRNSLGMRLPSACPPLHGGPAGMAR